MSNQPDIDIWEFVDCSKCHLRFSSDSGAPPQVPFWLTECAHVLCNNHLSEFYIRDQDIRIDIHAILDPDQSCAHCGTQNIQLLPLQRDVSISPFLICISPQDELFKMEPPMSDWFRSIPLSLDALASAAKVFVHIRLTSSKLLNKPIRAVSTGNICSSTPVLQD
jgi:hypothetical protein